MPEFMLLLHDDPSQFAELSPEAMQSVIEKYGVWARSLGARHKGGKKLTDSPGRVMRREGDSIAVVDGPYSETKEVIGGFFIIEAVDLDEAIALARDCPHAEYGVIEVREVDPT